VVSFTLRPFYLLSRWKGDWVSLRSGMGAVAKKKKFFTLPPPRIDLDRLVLSPVALLTELPRLLPVNLITSARIMNIITVIILLR
jgi:hypothetical protein